jgi:hypothetical protein
MISAYTPMGYPENLFLQVAISTKLDHSLRGDPTLIPADVPRSICGGT